MVPGRKQLSETEKKLAGTFRNDRVKNGIEFSLLTQVPVSPDWLDSTSKKMFTDIATLLISKNMLYESDVHLLAILAKELSVYEMSCRELKTKSKFVTKTKTGYQQPNPWVAIRSQAQKNVREIGSLFGLDPLSRSRFNIKEDKKEKNGFAEL
jgi:P27 family predicted phage terminase small subunit